MLDLGLPDMDGEEFIRSVRMGSAVPIIVLSARSDELDKVSALDLGANDYITKPFGTAELLARVRAALRNIRHNVQVAAPSSLFTVDDLIIDYDRRHVSVGGSLIHLTQTEYNIPAYLSQMKASEFLQVDTLIIIGLGLIAFVFDTFGGVMIAKLMNLFTKEKINPMIGAAGISAFPMSARVVHKMGLEEDNSNFLLMHSIGVNVSGQIASVIAGGLILALVKAMIGG